MVFQIAIPYFFGIWSPYSAIHDAPASSLVYRLHPTKAPYKRPLHTILDISSWHSPPKVLHWNHHDAQSFARGYPAFNQIPSNRFKIWHALYRFFLIHSGASHYKSLHRVYSLLPKHHHLQTNLFCCTIVWH